MPADATLERQVQAPTPERSPGALAHFLLFGAAAIAAYVGYTLLFL